MKTYKKQGKPCKIRKYFLYPFIEMANSGYLIGLGNMGLGNISKSERYMDKVLKDNCGHAGALFQPVKVA